MASIGAHVVVVVDGIIVIDTLLVEIEIVAVAALTPIASDGATIHWHDHASDAPARYIYALQAALCTHLPYGYCWVFGVFGRSCV